MRVVTIMVPAIVFAVPRIYIYNYVYTCIAKYVDTPDPRDGRYEYCYFHFRKTVRSPSTEVTFFFRSTAALVHALFCLLVPISLLRDDDAVKCCRKRNNILTVFNVYFSCRDIVCDVIRRNSSVTVRIKKKNRQARSRSVSSLLSYCILFSRHYKPRV